MNAKVPASLWLQAPSSRFASEQDHDCGGKESPFAAFHSSEDWITLPFIATDYVAVWTDRPLVVPLAAPGESIGLRRGITTITAAIAANKVNAR